MNTMISDISKLSVNIERTRIEKEKKNYSTLYSQVVPHLSTNSANSSLTSEIRRDPVLSAVYGHSW